MNAPSESVVIETADEPDASIIWLHGLGADGHDFEPIIPEMNLPEEAAFRFIFPHAPVRPVTLNGGAPMRAWFDIEDLDRNARQDMAGIDASCELLDSLIDAEVGRGISAERIVVAGFSQGGAIALLTGICHPRKLAGFMGLSTYIPLPDRVENEAHEANRETPIFMAHGTQDPMLPPRLGEESRALLEGLGYRVDWHTYPMPHAVCPPEIQHIRKWLLRVLAPETTA